MLIKAVIPAAGLGTRFLPYTKSQPKEMLPLLDKPAIQYVVEEALDSGIPDIFIITGRNKRAIEDHFDANPELERHLATRGRLEVLGDLNRILNQTHIAYVRQGTPRGNGHAVLCAESAVGNNSLAVLLGDDVTIGHPRCTSSLVRMHRKLGASCIAVQRVPRSQVASYGMVIGERVEEGVYRIRKIIEKPRRSQVKSNLVTIGRYVFYPEIFRHLREVRPGRSGEIWLTDAIRSLAATEDVFAWVYPGRRFDIGTREGWLLANLEMAWRQPGYRGHIRDFLSTNLRRGLGR